MRRRQAVSLLAIALLLPATEGCGFAAGSNPAVLARVDGRPVTRQDWMTALRVTGLVTGKRLGPPVAGRAEVETMVRQAAVERYAIDHRLTTSEAARRAAATYIRHHLRPSLGPRFRAKLTAAHLTPGALQAYVGDQMVLRAAYNRVTADVRPVTAAQIRRYYSEHRRAFATPRTYEVREILAPSRTRARSLLDQLRRGASFAALARRDSADAVTARSGGSLGWVDAGSASHLPPPLYRLIRRLPVGRIGIAHTRNGYHIIEVQATRPGAVAPMASVTAAIRAEVLRTEKNAVFRAWARGVEQRARVKMLTR